MIHPQYHYRQCQINCHHRATDPKSLRNNEERPIVAITDDDEKNNIFMERNQDENAHADGNLLVNQGLDLLREAGVNLSQKQGDELISSLGQSKFHVVFAAMAEAVQGDSGKSMGRKFKVSYILSS